MKFIKLILCLLLSVESIYGLEHLFSSLDSAFNILKELSLEEANNIVDILNYKHHYNKRIIIKAVRLYLSYYIKDNNLDYDQLCDKLDQTNLQLLHRICTKYGRNLPKSVSDFGYQNNIIEDIKTLELKYLHTDFNAIQCLGIDEIYYIIQNLDRIGDVNRLLYALCLQNKSLYNKIIGNPTRILQAILSSKIQYDFSNNHQIEGDIIPALAMFMSTSEYRNLLKPEKFMSENAYIIRKILPSIIKKFLSNDPHLIYRLINEITSLEILFNSEYANFVKDYIYELDINLFKIEEIINILSKLSYGYDQHSSDIIKHIITHINYDPIKLINIITETSTIFKSTYSYIINSYIYEDKLDISLFKPEETLHIISKLLSISSPDSKIIKHILSQINYNIDATDLFISALDFNDIDLLSLLVQKKFYINLYENQVIKAITETKIPFELINKIFNFDTYLITKMFKIHKKLEFNTLLINMNLDLELYDFNDEIILIYFELLLKSKNIDKINQLLGMSINLDQAFVSNLKFAHRVLAFSSANLTIEIVQFFVSQGARFDHTNLTTEILPQYLQNRSEILQYLKNNNIL